MKEIPLSQGKFALVDDEDFDFLSQWVWHASEGCHTYYAKRVIKVLGKSTTLRMHREILRLTDPKILIDHEDGDGLNNQKYNLRIATPSQNQMNQRKSKNKSSKYKGVSLFKPKNKTYTYWRTEIRFNGKKISLGVYKQEEDAALAYNMAALDLFGEFALINEL